MAKVAEPSVRFSPELFLWIVVGLAFTFWLFGLPLLYNRLTCPFQVSQGEAANVEFGRILSRGESLYFDPEQGPYLYPAYPPLFPLLLSWLSVLFPAPFFGGRLLALIGYFSCGGLMLAWGWCRWGRSLACALAFLFWVSPTLRNWGSMARMDTLLLAVQFGAFLLLYRGWIGKGKRWDPAAAGVLGALSLLLKQSAITLALAYGAACLGKKRFRSLGMFLVCVLLPVAVVFSVLEVSSHGWFFFWNFKSLPLAYHWNGFVYYLKTALLPETGWLILALVGTWVLRGLPLLLKCQLVFSSLLLLGMGREGAAENYLLEFWLYGLFALGEGWAMVPTTSRKRTSPIWPRWALACLLLLGSVALLRRPLPRIPSQAEMDMKASVLAIYRLPGEHLALDADLPLMAGKKVWLMPMEYRAMVEERGLDMAPLLRDIATEKFTTIELYDMSEQYLLPEAVTAQVERYYRVRTKAFGRRWYVPQTP